MEHIVVLFILALCFFAFFVTVQRLAGHEITDGINW